uniref:hypothetical protein n=1 Tax=Alistipes sp. TaxID=1872444 RepID=UPI00405766D0
MKKFVYLFLLPLFVGCVAPSTRPSSDEDIFRLYPTKNIWTFLKLNTATGEIWQVHFAVQDGGRDELLLNGLPLVEDGEFCSGRFELYSTENIYNFILLDQQTGRTWQTQWSYDEESRGIIPIKAL